jgi:hypothetical protein
MFLSAKTDRLQKENKLIFFWSMKRYKRGDKHVRRQTIYRGAGIEQRRISL